MSLTRNLAELQREHVSFELECIDRMYLNAYVPRLTSERGVALVLSSASGPSLRLDP
jgi:hypothetical protein